LGYCEWVFPFKVKYLNLHDRDWMAFLAAFNRLCVSIII
jgi:hypothetical protein